MKLTSAAFTSNLKRARMLYRQRGIKWLTISMLGEVFVLPSIFIRIANRIASTNVPSFFVTLAGVHSNQLWPERQAAMKRVAGQHLKQRSDILEIGSWFGRGSTQVWMSTLRSLDDARGSSLLLVDSWKPYVSHADTASGPSTTTRMDSIHHIAINSVLKEVYREEADNGLSISVIRASSKTFLPLLKERSFDLIYIDGSHYYRDAKRDMQEAKRLIRPNGLICGDDLDMLPTADLVDLARKNLDHDLLVLPDGHAFHPGVLLAVSEEFSRVDSENGFWWVTHSP